MKPTTCYGPNEDNYGSHTTSGSSPGGDVPAQASLISVANGLVARLGSAVEILETASNLIVQEPALPTSGQKEQCPEDVMGTLQRAVRMADAVISLSNSIAHKVGTNG